MSLPTTTESGAAGEVHVDTPAAAYSKAKLQRKEAYKQLSAEFMMTQWKVTLCPNRSNHDWWACPWGHVGEKARRRDPTVFPYKPIPCPDSLHGNTCPRGLACGFAHNVYEYHLHPAKYRTQMCNMGKNCDRNLCFFAHTSEELRFPTEVVPAAAPAGMAPNGGDATAILTRVNGAGGGGALQGWYGSHGPTVAVNMPLAAAGYEVASSYDLDGSTVFAPLADGTQLAAVGVGASAAGGAPAVGDMEVLLQPMLPSPGVTVAERAGSVAGGEAALPVNADACSGPLPALAGQLPAAVTGGRMQPVYGLAGQSATISVAGLGGMPGGVQLPIASQGVLLGMALPSGGVLPASLASATAGLQAPTLVMQHVTPGQQLPGLPASGADITAQAQMVQQLQLAMAQAQRRQAQQAVYVLKMQQQQQQQQQMALQMQVNALQEQLRAQQL